jgi:serine/threonine protein kinase HipA of HipAB toxin-antitoxin module
MLKKFGLAVVLLAGMGAPALAQSVCSEPIPPAALDGSTATKAQVVAASHDANNFMKAADDYQECVSLDYNKQVDAAKAAKKDVDPSITQASNQKIQASQQMKMKVGSEFQATLAAWKKGHPGG